MGLPVIKWGTNRSIFTVYISKTHINIRITSSFIDTNHSTSTTPLSKICRSWNAFSSKFGILAKSVDHGMLFFFKLGIWNKLGWHSWVILLFKHKECMQYKE